jgi:HAD superfamily hydrolase (TIGR01509 family)
MISFIYFDVGGVVIDDFSGNTKWQDLKRELGVNKSNNAAFDRIWKRYAPELCVDRDVETLTPILIKELGLQLPKDYSLLAGFVDRFSANPDIWPIIENLRSKTGLGLLTNMYPNMFAAIKKRHILPEVAWDQIIDSSIELLQKPDRKLFELAEKRAGVPHEEILFIDNGREHVQEAKDFGWQVFLYDASNHHAAVQELQRFLDRQEFQKGERPKTRIIGA